MEERKWRRGDGNREGKMRWKRVSGKIRIGDRVNGEIRIGGKWVGYKRRKKRAWKEEFFGEKILDVWEDFERLKKNLRERKYQKRERILKMMGV